MKKRSKYAPPPWMKKGARVHYSSVIGFPPDERDAVVLEDPFLVNQDTRGRGGTWCMMIDKRRGWVACEALTEAAP